MTYSEASSAINQIESEVNSFHSNLVSFINKLTVYANTISKIDYESILHEQLVNNINSIFSNVNSDLKSIISLCSNTYDTLVNDANRRIMEIVNTYNNSIKNKENKTYLSYVTLSSDSFNIPNITNIN